MKGKEAEIASGILWHYDVDLLGFAYSRYPRLDYYVARYSMSIERLLNS